MHPKELEIKDFTYHLPEDRIARYPLAERDSSKLLLYRNGKISQDIYRNIGDHIPENSLLIFNNSKVIHARLFFQNTKGERIEIFCLEPAEKYSDMASAMSSTERAQWHCMLGRANKWKEKTLEHRTDEFTLTAEITSRTSDAFTIGFSWHPGHFSFAEILDKSGMMPIPPYLKRSSEDIDRSRYQTVYAIKEGSVAAPTAGLHFTEEILSKLKAKNILTESVTLHVGASTFKPVMSLALGGHEMHGELIEIKQETIENILRSSDGNIIAIGTTSLRTIETLYWMGIKATINPGATLEELEIKQWDPYDFHQDKPVRNVLQNLLIWMQKNNADPLICKTQIIIAPPYRLKIARALVTNFHQPNSTLLLLVAAVIGDDWKKIYDYALSHDFRFLSYGDGSLLFAGGASTV